MNNSEIGSLSVYELQQQWHQNVLLFLLDVRTKQEVAFCRLPGSVAIAQSEVSLHLEAIPQDRDIIIYCHHGIRSQAVGRYLLSAGWDPERLFNLEGGIDAFSKYIDPSLPRY